MRKHWKIAILALAITIALVATARAGNVTKKYTDSKGPVYIYTPTDHDPSAGVVIYIHGKGKDDRTTWYVDTVWKKQKILEKFTASGSKAALVLIASWTGYRGVQWKRLDDLLKELKPDLGEIPYIHAIGHSGAWQNLRLWTGHVKLGHITLLDSTYGGSKAFRTFGETKRLDVAVSTSKPRKHAKTVLKGLKYATLKKLGDIATAKDRVTFLDLNISHRKWRTGNAITYYIQRGMALR